jgi:hypothetical protein
VAFAPRGPDPGGLAGFPTLGATMDVRTASLFFALLALACLATVAVVVVAAVLRRLGVVRLEGARTELGRAALGLAWVVALVATLGSLYYSEIADFTPCTLCWYQRICMYPLALILGIAAFRRDVSVRWYAVPLASIGAAFAAYHAWIQAYPPEGGSGFCTIDASCLDRVVWELGFVSLPLMALSGFSLVITMLLLARTEPLSLEDA